MDLCALELPHEAQKKHAVACDCSCDAHLDTHPASIWFRDVMLTLKLFHLLLHHLATTDRGVLPGISLLSVMQ